MVGAIQFQEPRLQGKEELHDILCFLDTGQAPSHLTKGERRWLAKKAVRYRLINEELYCMGKVPTKEEISTILHACHDGVCGGHFAHDITYRKILQVGFIWPSSHRDAHFWCKACDACQRFGPRKLTCEPQLPISSYGPFEKWGMDAISPCRDRAPKNVI